VQAAEAGTTFVEGTGVGRLSVGGDEETAPVWRMLQLPHPELLVSDGEYTFIAPTDPVRRRVGALYSALYRRTPLLLDTWRQSRNNTAPSQRSPMHPKAPHLEPVGAADPRPLQAGARPAAWVAMHWLTPAGAESWALRSAEIARDAGYDVVITVDRSAPHKALARALEITPHVYLAANVLAREDWDPFLRGVLARHDVEVLHIHHSARAYSFLPELRHVSPGVRVLDSTHVVEHRTGGFVRQSLEYSNLVDHHHVISPELRDLYVLDAHVSRDKVSYRPLTGPADRPRADARPVRAPGEPLRVGFLGRLAPQKRPFLFVELVRRLHRSHPGAFSFVMQGSGPLEPQVTGQIARHGLAGVITRRAWGPVPEFFSEVDVLVITSDNEGLTLTSLEADEHGVLVVSADVGSQRTVVAPTALVPRPPHAFLRRATETLVHLATDEGALDRAYAAQRSLLDELRSLESAEHFLTTYYSGLKER
jgi:glycosyltransferase involved in cell wall biosynthesis